jgi:hypothetical protein
MFGLRTITSNKFRLVISGLVVPIIFNCITSCHNPQSGRRGQVSSGISDSTSMVGLPEGYQPVYAMLVLPGKPGPGEAFRILSAGGEDILNAHVTISGLPDPIKSVNNKTGEELPCWRIDDFNGVPAGKYKALLSVKNKYVSELEFEVSAVKTTYQNGAVWKTLCGWDDGMEIIYSVWINALFYGCNEQSAWSALNDVTQDPQKNFLFNYLSLGEDDPEGKNKVIMQPDCADNPFFLRAYFAWKLGLPFGYHICDRGSINRAPGTGKWITNETKFQVTDPVKAFNSFLRKVMDGVHSGTSRTALDNPDSDYYPVALESASLRPGTVYADPYGHTLVITGLVKQTRNKPGLLLAVDAQPDGTIGIKRFWKGNFLFNTTEVIGEPGFKAFRPITFNDGVANPIKNSELKSSSGFVPFSLQQRNMGTDVFYHTMERIINPEPLDPEVQLLDLIQALYEQLLVRVISVSNGEVYMNTHPGSVIEMPASDAGIFLAGGMWENYSTPNRDLRLLIAMDAVLEFPDHVALSLNDYNVSKTSSAEIKSKLKSLLGQKASELEISYTRTDGSVKKLTITEILERRYAFEMAYNPNDGIEIRWGAPEGSEERNTCRRQAPSRQHEKMHSVRKWFQKRLHPPT